MKKYLRCMVAISGVLAAAAPAAASVPYALGSAHASARVSTGGEHFAGAAMQSDRSVVWHDLAGQSGLITVTQLVPTNADNLRVSATGAALVTSPTFVLFPPTARMNYRLGWSPGPLPRAGEITAGFDTAATDAPQAEGYMPQVYRTQFEGFEALYASTINGLPRQPSTYEILQGSIMTYEMEFEGHWVLGANGPGGARRSIVSYGHEAFTVVEDFVYDASRDVTRLFVVQEYNYSTFNNLLVSAILIGQPVPSPATAPLLLAVLAVSGRRRARDLAAHR